jgi:hypothetical protein
MGLAGFDSDPRLQVADSQSLPIPLAPAEIAPFRFKARVENQPSPFLTSVVGPADKLLVWNHAL